MPSTRDIRRRIKSVKNTAQITKAMQMVASAKMRKAQQAAQAGRPYAKLMNNVLSAVSAGAGDFSNPLIEVRVVKKRALIIISTDKGLCGGLNTNLLREATKYDKATTVHVTAGRKASQFVARTKRELAAEFTYKDNPAFAEARAISKFAQELFTSGKVDQVDVLYTNFISTMVQKPEVRQLLPIREITALDADVQPNETLRVVHGDVVAIREGFHPFVTAHGYDAYYLNVLAGDRRSMAASDDPRYAHFRREWPPPDPRLPLVSRP